MKDKLVIKYCIRSFKVMPTKSLLLIIYFKLVSTARKSAIRFGWLAVVVSRKIKCALLYLPPTSTKVHNSGSILLFLHGRLQAIRPNQNLYSFYCKHSAQSKLCRFCSSTSSAINEPKVNSSFCPGHAIARCAASNTYCWSAARSRSAWHGSSFFLLPRRMLFVSSGLLD